MSDETKPGWLADQIKTSERNIELRDPYRTVRLERELDEANAKLAMVREAALAWADKQKRIHDEDVARAFLKCANEIIAIIEENKQ